MSEVIARLIVTLALGPKIPAALATGRKVVKAMTGNAYFPNATAALTSASGGLDTLQAQASIKGNSVAARRQLSVCWGLFDALKGVVQTAADADPANAATIIRSAAMGIKKARATKPKPDIAADYGYASGMAKLVAKAYGRASYLWQASTDGSTWTTLPTTLKATTLVQGLTPGQKYWFRLKVTTKNGERDWVQTASALVMK
jgi:hypothetical protein